MILWKQFVAKVILAMSFVALNANAAAVELWSEYSTTEIQQSNNYYNYIKNIQPAVDKYYPQYSAYFKNVLAKFNDYGTGEKYIINKWINRDLKTYWDYWKLTSEKDKAATALIVFDYLEWDSKFIKDPKINQKNSDWSEDTKVEAATWILKWIKWEYDRYLKDRDKLGIELKKIGKSIDSWVTKENSIELLWYYEKVFKRYKEYYIDAWLILESQVLQESVKSYIRLLKITWKGASEVGKIYIDEYNRIIKK